MLKIAATIPNGAPVTSAPFAFQDCFRSDVDQRLRPTIAGTVVDMNQHHVFVRTEGGVQEFKPVQIIKI